MALGVVQSGAHVTFAGGLAQLGRFGYSGQHSKGHLLASTDCF